MLLLLCIGKFVIATGAGKFYCVQVGFLIARETYERKLCAAALRTLSVLLSLRMSTTSAENVFAILTLGRLLHDLKTNAAGEVLIYRWFHQILLTNESLHCHLDGLFAIEIVK